MPATPSQVLSEATEDNLIDLGPGSPAVVTPMANATPPSSLPASVASVAPVRSASPASLASKLAVLGESHLLFLPQAPIYEVFEAAFSRGCESFISEVWILFRMENINRKPSS